MLGWCSWPAELAREAVERGIVEQISGVIVWRWLSADAIKPWQHRSWIFPRDPRFAERAGPILDLYEGRWEGELLVEVSASSADYVKEAGGVRRTGDRAPHQPTSDRAL